MKNIRIIPRLDIKGPNVVKPVQTEALRIVGSPKELAHRYYKEGADELIYFPLYNSEKINGLTANINNAKHVLINTCDLLPCPPYDSSCNQKHKDFINLLKVKFSLKSQETYGSCEYYTFGT